MRILNLGAGVQSTTVYLMALRKEIEPIDFAVFADTQEEPKAVYTHLEWLKSLDGPPILTGTLGKLGDDLIKGRTRKSGKKGFFQIPTFIEGEGMLARQCTAEYKVDIIERIIRREIFNLKPRQRLKAGSAVQIFGISTDEAGRAGKILKRLPKWSRGEFPLIEKRMHRFHCLQWLKAFGIPHQVPRSACVFCPYHSNEQWAKLKAEDPEGWRRAVEIDEEIRKPGAACNRKLEGRKTYLHRDRVPLSEVDLSKPQMELFFTDCEGLCGN